MPTLVLAELLGPDGIVVVVVVVLLLLFGGSRLPQLARGLGSAASEFRKGIATDEDDDKSTESTESKQSPAASTDSLATPEQASSSNVAPSSTAE